ncbi:MAG: protein translocase subunit SecF [Patescibacteria group bacterium]
MIYRFLGRKKFWWLLISGLIMLPGVVSLFVWKLPLGIDFRGGGAAEWQFNQPISEDELRDTLANQGQLKGVTVSRAGENSVFVKFLPAEVGEYQASLTGVREKFGEVTEVKFENVGPSVSQDLTRKAIIAVIVASLFILLYLAYSFRGVSYPVSSWRFGTVALIALLHDLVISVGAFSILAHFFGYEVDSSFITALLTIMGFSVHDTIVVFDRIRENLAHKPVESAEEFEKIADDSLSQTLNRSIGTSLTVIFTLTALLLLGGESIRAFVVTMLVGITVGTYSSIFTATPILTLWQQRVYHRSNSGQKGTNTRR